MTLFARLVLAAVFCTILAGCGNSKPTPPATDPESVRKLEDLQKKAARGEK